MSIVAALFLFFIVLPAALMIIAAVLEFLFDEGGWVILIAFLFPFIFAILEEPLGL